MKTADPYRRDLAIKLKRLLPEGHKLRSVQYRPLNDAVRAVLLSPNSIGLFMLKPTIPPPLSRIRAEEACYSSARVRGDPIGKKFVKGHPERGLRAILARLMPISVGVGRCVPATIR